ncbi:hypothetical protein HK104_005519 [Borealophlyctis nickersoniae]|nr:hypothetical protein HK104_005519 [Borealophlyctis nickersoniae]
MGLLYLAGVRDQLEAKNLHDSYNSNDYPTATCTAADRFARTLDGTCNDLDKPAMGSLGYRFGRNIPVEKGFPDEGKLMTPNPRTIGQKLMMRDTFKPATTLNMFVLSWIQFQVHDWMDHERDWGSPIDVPIPDGDPLAGTGQKIYLPRSVPDTTQTNSSRPKAFKNRVTHWWDMSQIYGTDRATNQRIRTGVDGKLKIENNLLPIDETGIEITGFRDNWWSGLSMLHSLFTLEHNAICDMFKAKNPGWTDQMLHDKARLVLTAVNAKIHTVEWTPGILQNKILKSAMETNWDGLLPDGLAELANGGPIFSGIVGGETHFAGVPFSLTEEFTAVYRFHSLLPDTINVRSRKTKQSTGRIYDMPAVTFAGSRKMMTENELGDLIFTFGTANPGALTLNNYPKWLMNLTKPNEPNLIDLATTEIYRDRERGIPRYVAFRNLLQLSPVRDWNDINPDAKVQALLKSVYSDINDVDLLTGTLAEEPRPDGYGFSNTAFQVFILMASRRLFTDRFLTADYSPAVYTQDGLNWIKQQGTFKAMVTRHFPEMKPFMDTVDNPFKPWKA